MDDYGFAGQRRSKCDKRAKARFMKYKKGGQFRATGIKVTGSDNKAGN